MDGHPFLFGGHSRGLKKELVDVEDRAGGLASRSSKPGVSTFDTVSRAVGAAP